MKKEVDGRSPKSLRFIIVSAFGMKKELSASQRILLLIKGLSQNGENIKFITFGTTEDELPDELKDISVTVIRPSIFARALKKAVVKFRKSGLGSLSFEEKDSHIFSLYTFFFLQGYLLPLVKTTLTVAKTVFATLKERRTPVLVTSTPPACYHLIGLAVKLIFGRDLVWIADYQDPLSHSPFLKSTNSLLYRITDRSVMRGCDLATVPFKNLQDYLNKVAVRLNAGKPVEFYLLPKGIDRRDTPRSSASLPIEILYGGSIYKSQLPGLEALLHAIENRSEFKFVYAGPSFQLVQSILNSANVKNCEVLGFLAHDEYQAVVEKAGILLVLGTFLEGAAFYGGKLYELLGYEKPVLYIGPETDEIREIALKAGGMHVSKDDPDEILSVLKRIEKELKEKARHRKEEFYRLNSPAAVATRFVEKIRSLCP